MILDYLVALICLVLIGALALGATGAVGREMLAVLDERR